MPDTRTPDQIAAWHDLDAVLSRQPLTMAELNPAPRELPRTSIEAVEADGPAHFGAALINGDWSGMTDAEEADCRAWIARHPGRVVDMSDTWFGTYSPAFGAPMGCDMATFTLLVER